MGPSTAITISSRRWIVLLFGLLMAAGMVFLSTPTGAHADAPDTPGADQEQTDYYFGGVVTFEGEPVEGVTMSIEGGGFDAETVTNAEGRWRLYVPEKDDYVLTIEEDTLPEGVIVDPEQLPEGTQPIEGTSGSFEVTFGRLAFVASG